LDGGVGFVTEVNFGETANILRALTRNSNVNPAATSNNVIDLTKRTLLTPPGWAAPARSNKNSAFRYDCFKMGVPSYKCR
jgi:hypothetical protein